MRRIGARVALLAAGPAALVGGFRVLFQALAGVLAVVSTALLVFSKNIRQFFSRLPRGTRRDEDDNE